MSVSLWCVCSHVVVFGLSEVVVVPYVYAVVAVTECTVVCVACVYAERV